MSRTLDRIETDDVEKSRVLFFLSGVQNRAGSRPATAICLVLTNAKNQFRAGAPQVYRTCRFCKFCKHVKTLGFGIGFPYRRETLQNCDDESQIFELLQFGTIPLII